MSASRLLIEDYAIATVAGEEDECTLETGKLADTASGARESRTASKRLVARSEKLMADGHKTEVTL